MILFNSGIVKCTIENLTAPKSDYLYFRNFPFEEDCSSYVRVEDIIECVRILSMNGLDVDYTNNARIRRRERKFVIPVNPLSLALESQEMRVIDCLEECGAKMQAYEIAPSIIYSYQDDFDFFDNIRQKDISSWPNAMVEYTRYLSYRRRINAHDIEVISVFDNDNYKRPKMIKRVIDTHRSEE